MDYSNLIEYLNEPETVQAPPRISDMRELLGALGDPHNRFTAIHIAGTNGKGSTASMIASILRCAGYQTGLYTSPHISRINERICVNSEISDTALCAYAQKVKDAQDDLGLSLNYFQKLTAIGFLHFAQGNCRIAVIEAGMGGRLDPTNVLEHPAVTVVTRIGMDHMAQLGDTLAQIAWEKSGIIKPGCDAVLLAQQKEAEQPVKDACEKTCARLIKTPALQITLREGSLFADTEYGQLRIGLSGSYQAENAALALAAIRALHSRGFEIPAKAVCEGMDLARWPGRFELLRANPPLLLDGAHNPQGAQSLYDSLQTYYPGRRCVFLMAAMRDKDAAGCIRAVAPLARAMVAVPLPFPRAYAAPQLAALMLEHCKTVYTAASIEDGLRTALSLAQPDDIVCAFGSLYMADPLRTAVKPV